MPDKNATLQNKDDLANISVKVMTGCKFMEQTSNTKNSGTQILTERFQIKLCYFRNYRKIKGSNTPSLLLAIPTFFGNLGCKSLFN